MENAKDYSIFKKFQQKEVDGSFLYKEIAKIAKDKNERETLLFISEDELKHAKIFEKYTGIMPKPRHVRIFFYLLAARLFGYTFIIKLLERTEESSIMHYKNQIDPIPELDKILKEEEIHEKKLLELLDEERLKYIGDIVLGMNDALVELTGALAGYTLAMQNTNIIAMAGLITGISATLSMAASSFLSSREEGSKNAMKSSIYTGFAYLLTVAMLITPYLILPIDSYLQALAITLVVAIVIIASYNFYISVAKSRPFFGNFLVMTSISIGVAVISFAVGILVKNVLGIDI